MTADLLHGLAAATLAGSLAILGVLALRIPVRRAFGAQAAYALWALVPLAAAATWLPAPARPVLKAFVARDAAAPVAAVDAAAAADAVRAVLFADASFVLVALWLAGAGLTAAGFVLQQRRYRNGLGRLTRLGRPYGAGVFLSASAQGGPALVGALRPRIVLPADFDRRYDAAERALVLAHERAHLARWDTRVNAFAAALRCLNWFNPLVHLAASRLRFDQELACDAAVVARFPEARRRYADAMLKTQLAGQARQELPLPAGCHWSATHPFKERILMLKHPVPTRLRRTAGFLLASALCAAGSYAVWQAQPARAADGYTGITFDIHIAGHDPRQPIEVDASGVTAALAPQQDEAGAQARGEEPSTIAVRDSDVAYVARDVLADGSLPGNAVAIPAGLIEKFYQDYGKTAYIRYGAKDDSREIALTAVPAGDAIRVHVEFKRRGQPAAPIDVVVADDASFDLRKAAGEVRTVLDGLDDVTFTVARTSLFARAVAAPAP